MDEKSTGFQAVTKECSYLVPGKTKDPAQGLIARVMEFQL